MNLNQVKLYDLTPSVLKYYKQNVKNNEDETYDTARLKLSANICFSKPKQVKHKRHQRLYYYGNLAIVVDTRNDTIVWIHNYTYEDSDYNKRVAEKNDTFMKRIRNKRYHLLRFLGYYNLKNKIRVGERINNKAYIY